MQTARCSAGARELEGRGRAWQGVAARGDVGGHGPLDLCHVTVCERDSHRPPPPLAPPSRSCRKARRYQSAARGARLGLGAWLQGTAKHCRHRPARPGPVQATRQRLKPQVTAKCDPNLARRATSYSTFHSGNKRVNGNTGKISVCNARHGLGLAACWLRPRCAAPGRSQPLARP